MDFQIWNAARSVGRIKSIRHHVDTYLQGNRQLTALWSNNYTQLAAHMRPAFNAANFLNITQAQRPVTCLTIPFHSDGITYTRRLQREDNRAVSSRN